MADRHRLPTIPAVHARAMAVLNDPNLEIKHLATLVETDPSLTAAVIRSANSAASGTSRRIATAGEAVVRIGLNTTRRIVMSAVIGESYRGLERSGINTGELWRHVIACALIADSITALGPERSTSFTAGLLHDVGRMAMAQADPIRYSRIVHMAREGVEATETESQVFGRSHAEWGMEAAETWALPADVIEAIGDHHNGTAGPIARAVFDSRRITASLRIGDGIIQIPPAGADENLELLLPDADYEVIEAMGGLAHVMEQIDWFSGAIKGARRAA